MFDMACHDIIKAVGLCLTSAFYIPTRVDLLMPNQWQVGRSQIEPGHKLNQVTNWTRSQIEPGHKLNQVTNWNWSKNVKTKSVSQLFFINEYLFSYVCFMNISLSSFRKYIQQRIFSKTKRRTTILSGIPRMHQRGFASMLGWSFVPIVHMLDRLRSTTVHFVIPKYN